MLIRIALGHSNEDPHDTFYEELTKYILIVTK